jgi:hypothetical protein
MASSRAYQPGYPVAVLFDLTGQAVIVTRGSRGLGLEIARDLARRWKAPR